MTTTGPACPVCGQREGLVEVERRGAYTIRRCPSCELQFSDPMSYSAAMYDQAYGGPEAGALEAGVGGVDYRSWIAGAASLTRHEKALRRSFYRGMVISKAQEAALRWLRSQLRPGARVLDIGCGPGTFLSALRATGFEAVGMDVARAACDQLRRRGFEVHDGMLADYPPAAVPPAAVTFFEVLEHLDDPVGFLRQVEARFPGALIAFSVPSPRRVALLHGREEWDFPPHHLTRWSERAIRVALESANLSLASLTFPAPGPGEFSGTGLGTWLMPAPAAASPTAASPAAASPAAASPTVAGARPAAPDARAPWRMAALWLGKMALYSPLMLLRRLQGYSDTSLCVTARSSGQAAAEGSPRTNAG